MTKKTNNTSKIFNMLGGNVMILLIGEFIQNQILGMKWLNDLIGHILNILGVNLSSRVGASLHFFIYDVIKIGILLCTLIFIISYIQSYFPPERSKKILSKFKGIWGNIISALLGTVTPFCSCSSIPLFIGFTSAGLPLGVTFSFLISSPMVDLGSLVLLMSIFGAKVAIVYVLLGLLIAVIGGIIIEKLGLESEVEDFILNAPRGIQIEDAKIEKRERLLFAKNAVVETLIEKILGGNNPLGVVLATLVGVPMYADIFGTIPIAEALLSKGAMLGTILAFMMGVTTLSLPSMIMLRKAIKPKLLYIFIGITTLGIIIVGYIFNLLQNLFI